MFGDSDSDFEEDNQLNYELECINNYSCNLTKEQKRQLLNYRHKNNGLLAFHEGTEEALCLFVEKNCMNFNNDNDRYDTNYHKKKMKRVLRTIDVYCYSRHWMMHAGDIKMNLFKIAIEKAIEKRLKNRAGFEGLFFPFFFPVLGRFW